MRDDEREKFEAWWKIKNFQYVEEASAWVGWDARASLPPPQITEAMVEAAARAIWKYETRERPKDISHYYAYADDYRELARAALQAALSTPQPPTPDDGWLTVRCERAFYVSEGNERVLCDRLPSPVTLVLKLSGEADFTERPSTEGASASEGAFGSVPPEPTPAPDLDNALRKSAKHLYDIKPPTPALSEGEIMELRESSAKPYAARKEQNDEDHT